MNLSFNFAAGYGLTCLSFTLIGGEFINLDFDSPNLDHLETDPILQAQYGVPQEIIPGWRITQDGIPIDRVWFFNQGAIAPITLSQSTSRPNQFLAYYSGLTYIGGIPQKKAITFSQLGTIPIGSLSLEFVWSGRDNIFNTPLHLNGEVVPIRVDPERGYDYTADVSRWAGQEVLLSLEFPSGTAGYLDNLRFTVPEPTTWALLGLGGAVLGWTCRRRTLE